MTEYQNQPTVMLNIVGDPTLLRGVLDACPAMGWRGVNLAYTSNYIPTRQPPIGAIIDESPAGLTLADMREKGVPIVSSMDHEDDELKRVPRAGWPRPHSRSEVSGTFGILNSRWGTSRTRCCQASAKEPRRSMVAGHTSCTWTAPMVGEAPRPTSKDPPPR